MTAAVADARRPVRHFSADELCSLDAAALVERSVSACTVELAGTGFSHVADLLVRARSGLVVLGPLAVALDECLVAVAARRGRVP